MKIDNQTLTSQVLYDNIFAIKGLTDLEWLLKRNRHFGNRILSDIFCCTNPFNFHYLVKIFVSKAVQKPL